jgi:TniQ
MYSAYRSGQAMTLDRYDGTGLRIRQDIRAVNRAFPRSRMRFSRFCPDCLRDSGGRWQLFWRLGWAFACEKHRCLLVDECPACGQRQRARPLRADVVPNPGHCATQAADATGGAPARCGTNLHAAPALRFAADHPVLTAQCTIGAAMETGTATFGIYRDHSVPTAAALADIRAVAGRILAYATEADLARILPADLHAAYRQLKTRSDDVSGVPRCGDKPGLAAPGHAVIAAVGATAALGILDAPDIACAGDALRWLVTGGRAKGLAVSSSNIGWGKRSTHLLTATQLVALGVAGRSKWL